MTVKVLPDTHQEPVVVEICWQWVDLVVSWRFLHNVVGFPESEDSRLILDGPPLILNETTGLLAQLKQDRGSLGPVVGVPQDPDCDVGVGNAANKSEVGHATIKGVCGNRKILR